MSETATIETGGGKPPRARKVLSRAAMYDIIRSPLITEKATTLSEKGQIGFRVAIEATKPEIRAASRGAVRGEGGGGEHAGAEGQGQALPQPAGPALGRQEGVRDAGTGPVDRPHGAAELSRGSARWH